MAREKSGTRHEERNATVTTKNVVGPDQEIERKGSASVTVSGSGADQGTSERDGIRMKVAGIEAEIMTDIEMLTRTNGVIVKE